MLTYYISLTFCDVLVMILLIFYYFLSIQSFHRVVLLFFNYRRHDSFFICYCSVSVFNLHNFPFNKKILWQGKIFGYYTLKMLVPWWNGYHVSLTWMSQQFNSARDYQYELQIVPWWNGYHISFTWMGRQFNSARDYQKGILLSNFYISMFLMAMCAVCVDKITNLKQSISFRFAKKIVTRVINFHKTFVNYCNRAFSLF